MYDSIGDVHGYAEKLKALLLKLKYSEHYGYYSHPTRKAVFVGDLIDRGEQVRETIRIVRAMVENGAALMVMGNHEYNAICFHSPKKGGGHLREHGIKNILQHIDTLQAFRMAEDELKDHITWFKTLPMFLELDGLRIIHACWDHSLVEYVRKELPGATMTRKFLERSIRKGTRANRAVEVLLKGREIPLPDKSVTCR